MTDFVPFTDPITLPGGVALQDAPLSVLAAFASDTSQLMVDGLAGLTCYATDGDTCEGRLFVLECLASDAANIMVGQLSVLIGYANNGLVAPDVAVTIGSILLGCDATGYAITFGDVDAPLAGLATVATDTAVVMLSDIGLLQAEADDGEHLLNSVLSLLTTGGYFVLTVGHFSMDLSSGGNITMLSTLDLALALYDRVVATASLRLSNWHTKMELIEHPVVRAATSLMLSMVLADNATANDTLDETRHVMSVMSDVMLATGVVDLPYQARMALAVIGALSDRTTLAEYLQLTDSVIADLVVSADVARIAELLDTAEVSDTIIGRLSAIVVAQDELQGSDTIGQQLAASMDLLDQAFVGGRFVFEGIPYTIYSMTTVGAAMSEIEGWDYDAFFVLGGVAYATSPRGIVRIEGDDDEGTPIDASVRVGLQNFGSSLEKRFPNVYLGLRSDGAMALGVTTTYGGVKKQNWYRLSPIPKPTETTARFDIDKGLHSVYWDWELRNLDGGNFSLDFIKVWQVQLTRRKQT